jgi:hypothetical protein
MTVEIAAVAILRSLVLKLIRMKAVALSGSPFRWSLPPAAILVGLGHIVDQFIRDTDTAVTVLGEYIFQRPQDGLDFFCRVIATDRKTN